MGFILGLESDILLDKFDDFHAGQPYTEENAAEKEWRTQPK